MLIPKHFLLLIGLFIAYVSAQTVNICGRITDPQGNPLKNTLVRLSQTTIDKGFGPFVYMTKTDSSGYYHLGTGNCTVPVNYKETKLPRAIAFLRPDKVGGQILFSIPQDNLKVTIGLYNTTGQFIKEILNTKLSKGNYGFRIDIRDISKQFYILRVTVNGASSVFKIHPFSSLNSAGIAQNNLEYNTKLEKLAAVIDTLRVTEPGYKIGILPIEVLTGTYNFTLEKNHTWNGDTVAFWGNTSSYPTNGSYVILNRTNGVWPDSKIYWSIQQNGTKVSLAQQSTVQIPGGGGRFYIWIAPSDSNNRYFDFVEVNYNGGTWNGNTTQVDGFRLPITFRAHTATRDVILGSSYHMFYQSRQSKFEEFINECPKEFTRLATQNFANIYAMHTPPVNLFNTGGPYVDYFSKYEDTVLAHNPGQTKANAWQISACAGGMGSNPSYCAAVNRHCGHLPQTEWRNPANYYLEQPANYFSNWVHRRSIRNFAYGFPYDDVAEQAAFASVSGVQWIAIAIGW